MIYGELLRLPRGYSDDCPKSYILMYFKLTWVEVPSHQVKLTWVKVLSHQINQTWVKISSH